MAIWFTSDTHFNHANICVYSGRPWTDVHEMNMALMERWNARVKPTDTVYHLGDFALGKVEGIAPIRQLLNGYIVLVLGNHDRSGGRMRRAGIDQTHSRLEIELEGHRLLLTHHPRKVEQLDEAGVEFNLHGHVHQTYARKDRLINVGVDVRGYAPASLAELLA